VRYWSLKKNIIHFNILCKTFMLEDSPKMIWHWMTLIIFLIKKTLLWRLNFIFKPFSVRKNPIIIWANVYCCGYSYVRINNKITIRKKKIIIIALLKCNMRVKKEIFFFHHNLIWSSPIIHIVYTYKLKCAVLCRIYFTTPKIWNSLP